ncbi:alpha/beta fold hydrolase [Streptomyces sp. NPDC088354]|uniref:alpha/beta fold hydrolase n=1 Tax=unclassified Streptomyces TaxID=2593676 RepID=UPI0029B472FE|nr:alpha/beta hydrolase [Streptomyces sp. MI02-7b]MDX3073631.1 alpha/beta hydrolase [Streptomyces sp. MI02-7b]
MSTETRPADWDIRTAGPADARHRALLLPGGMCTAEFYADVMAEPAIADARLGMTAVTLPGFGRTPAPEDVSVENYARLLGRLAAERDCDLVVGQGLGSTVAIEMAVTGAFAGPLVLLSPSFSRDDEAREFALLDRLGRVPGLGGAAWAVALRLFPRAARDGLPPGRRDTLAAVLADNDPAFCHRALRHYYDHLDRHGSLVPRLCATALPVWVVRGDADDIGLTDGERRDLDACPTITLVPVPRAGHGVLVEQPARVASIIAEAAARLG